ncbi:hypothetical protein GCM10010124_15090 [Pilimelia terevasa]|uniref:Diguanylate cyclase/phosphodiesterase n=1 Tax=Pilimelia terevasa TaxID=53372 RepID=A0A8J3BIB4_9ACTN|nr:EAL domain-containing protein [Pilimelia terevasa]GGK23620.1 hypothetical protein GCM10010124_15090 [Pilimelia terevasa]
MPSGPVLVGALATAMSVLWVLVMAAGARPPVVVTWVTTTIPATAVATLYCWRTAGGLAGSVPRRFWRLVAVSLGAQGVGGLLSMREMLNTDGIPTTGSPLTIVVYLVAVCVTAWALLGLPARVKLPPAERRRFAADATIVVLTVGYVAWRLSFSQTAAWQRLGGAFAIMTIVLLGAVVVFTIAKFAVLGVGGVDHGALHRLSASVGVAAGLATLAPLLAAQAHVHAAMVCLPPVSLGVILAARRQAGVDAAEEPPPRRRRFSYLPYIAVAATDGMLIWEALRLGDRFAILAAAVAVALTALVVYRQISALTDNAQLLHRVDRTVRDLQDVQHQLSHQAEHDALTGLANRRLFADRMTALLAAGATASVVLIDLDDFKTVNDQLGHAVGDELLVSVAQRLQACVRPDDTVARLGGDEFAMLLPALSAQLGTGILERINAAMAEPLRIAGHELLVRCSIGIADVDAGMDGTEVLRRADLAMYAAKDAGKGRYASYDAELDARAHHDAQLGAELRRAMEDGALSLVYQPVVRIADGAAVGAEAVIRWNHPHRGMLPLDEFVATAERTGLIVPLGDWALREACRTAAGWLRGGSADTWTVSVNISARQLHAPGFAASVAEALADAGLPAARLAIEVTETAIFDSRTAAGALAEVALLGVTVTLDHFGAGHSALGVLRTAPVRTLKVDKAFVEGVTGGPADATIAAAMVAIADGLGLTLVAEGVATAAQARQLAALGYRFAQGQHFGGLLSADRTRDLFVGEAAVARSG